MKYDCVILANPEGKAWNFAKSIYENLKERDSFKGHNSGSVYLNEVQVERFRDGEIKVKIKDNIRKRDCFVVHDSSLPPAEWVLQIELINEALRSSSAQEITDVLPYFRFARQDRKDESRVAVSAKLVLMALERCANRILSIDVHNSAIPGFSRIPFDHLYSARVLHTYLEREHPYLLENTVVMSPDAGGTSRARAFANRLGIENIAIGNKYRPKPGDIAELQVTGDVEGRNVLIIDDIVDSGTTLVEAKRALNEKGAKKVYAYGTHGLFSRVNRKKDGVTQSEDSRDIVAESLDGMITTNSIHQPPHQRIEVVSLENLFAEAIYRTNEGLSLSALFER